jgi:hypothetical protein
MLSGYIVGPLVFSSLVSPNQDRYDPKHDRVLSGSPKRALSRFLILTRVSHRINACLVGQSDSFRNIADDLKNFGCAIFGCRKTAFGLLTGSFTD